ncbi:MULTISPECIES: YlbF family regulator [Bacillaceae]|uniref:YlbF family regulator n=1 Tax=Gottfriedia acidiceleris TaxID=371036 RepID=A0ABY4JK17_9BACI|nr:MULTISPECIES: YlbF family regulator [Bacillaceae]KQL40320.1 regulator [Bacillus sp. FJAT-25509]PGM54881.1 regulator [Bacillus sp. AFS053548]UPM53168.1 YlbF family regulator [Gottfriedia acidiceleris]
MYATMETLQLITVSEELASMIVQSDVADQYRTSYIALNNDKTAQEIISRFMKTKDLYEDVQRFGKYHPDYKEIRKKMSEVKRELQLNDTIAAFKQAEDQVQLLLDETSYLIAQAVSPSVKVPAGNPFFVNTGGGCSTGGCGTGGKCGCKTR